MLALNNKQEEAINVLTGPVLVLAGPGTGKTTIVVERICKLLETNVDPDEILSITLTNAAASEMRTRLLNKAGQQAGKVNISTIHSFCADIITTYSHEFEFLSEIKVCDPITRYQIIREAIDDLGTSIKFLKTGSEDRYFYVKDISGRISIFKKENVQKAEYIAKLLIWEKECEQAKKIWEECAGKRGEKTRFNEYESIRNRHGKANELWQIYELYQTELKKRSLIDFDDMVLLVLEKLESNPAFKKQIASFYQYILIDEFQDSNNAQNELIYRLVEDNEIPNIFVVGDDDQSIFRFQGASTKNFHEFLDRFNNRKVVPLQENHRSSQIILDTAYSVIELDTTRLEVDPKYNEHKISKKLKAESKDYANLKNKIILCELPNRDLELSLITTEIEKIVREDSSLPLSEIAILARTNKELESIGYQLEQCGIKYQIGGKKNILNNPAIRQTILLLTAICDPTDDHAISTITNSPMFNLNYLDMLQISLEKNRFRKEPLISLINKQIEAGIFKDKHKVEFVIEFINEFRQKAIKQDIYSLIIDLYNFYPFLQDKKFKKYQSIGIKSLIEVYLDDIDRRLENIAALRKFANLARDFYKHELHKKDPLTVVSNFLEYLDFTQQYSVEINADQVSILDNAVQLCTVHDSKGKEFEYVFITSLNSQRWEKSPGARDKLKIPIESTGRETNLAEEIRVFYVALTRAKKQVYITRANTIDGSDKTRSDLLEPFINNPNLTEIKQYTPLTSEDITSEEAEMVKRTVTRYIEQYDKKLEFEKSLIQIAKERPLSPTALNTYLECPNKFKYSHLYRIPTKQIVEKHMVFGQCVHNALDKFWKKAISENKHPEKEELINWFKALVEDQVFETETDKINITEKGIEVLGSVHNKLLNTPISSVIGTEISSNIIKFEDMLLTGKFDILQSTDLDKKYRVSDYKTGEPKTKNWVIGQTKDSDGTYFNQLKFYKLLGSLMPEKFDITEGSILFVQEIEKSVHLPLTNEDLEEIKQKIRDTYNSIMKADFHPVSENQSADPCDRCEYKRICAVGV